MSLKSDSAMDSRSGGFSTDLVAAMGERNDSNGRGAGVVDTFVVSVAISKQLWSNRRKQDHGRRGRGYTLRDVALALVRVDGRPRSRVCRDISVAAVCTDRDHRQCH